MSITWGPSGLHYIVGSTAGDSGTPPYIQDTQWEAGDTIRFATFQMGGGETISSYKVIMEGVEYDANLVSLGSSIWRLDFQYTDYPAWAGYAEGTWVDVDAKVVGSVSTYLASDFYGANSFLMVGKADTPNPADSETDVPLDTSTLTFACPNYDENIAQPFYGRLWKDDVYQKGAYLTGLSFDISSENPLEDGAVYTWRVDTRSDTGSGITGDVWTFTAGEAPDPPDKATNPSPTNSSTTVTLDHAELTWTQGVGADTEEVFFGPSGSMVSVQDGIGTTFDLSDYIPFPYGTAYQWRIDSTNDDGTTTGDTWSFTTITLSPPVITEGSYQVIKRLCACAENRFWYEDI